MDEDATMTDAAAEEFLGGVAAHVARRRSSEAAAAHGRPRSSAGHGDASAASRSHGPAAAAFLNTPASIEKQVEAVGVVDTNWLCNHRDLLIAFVGLEPANCRLIIPYMVIQEIDAFKKAVPSRRHKGTAPPGNAAGLETRAYRSNLLLYQLFSQHNPYVQGQKVYEYLEHSQPNDTPDDIILDCARFQQLFRAEKVTLLTDDKNLRVKALVHGIAIVERTPPNAKALLDALLNPSIPLAADDPRRRLPTAACASRARPPRSVPSVSRCERDWSSTSVRGAAASTTEVSSVRDGKAPAATALPARAGSAIRAADRLLDEAEGEGDKVAKGSGRKKRNSLDMADELGKGGKAKQRPAECSGAGAGGSPQSGGKKRKKKEKDTGCAAGPAASRSAPATQAGTSSEPAGAPPSPGRAAEGRARGAPGPGEISGRSAKKQCAKTERGPKLSDSVHAPGNRPAAAAAAAPAGFKGDGPRAPAWHAQAPAHRPRAAARPSPASVALRSLEQVAAGGGSSGAAAAAAAAAPAPCRSPLTGLQLRDVAREVVARLAELLPGALERAFRESLGDEWRFAVRKEKSLWSVQDMLQFVKIFWHPVFSDYFSVGRKADMWLFPGVDRLTAQATDIRIAPNAPWSAANVLRLIDDAEMVLSLDAAWLPDLESWTGGLRARVTGTTKTAT